MSEHHGVIRFRDNDVAATIILRSTELRLFSQDVEMGVWPVAEYRLEAAAGGSTYTLHAEGEALTFLPNNAARLAAELEQLTIEGGTPITEEIPVAAEPAPEVAANDPSFHPVEVIEGPAPKLLTRLLFYMLLLATLATGVWAAMSLID